MQSARGRQPDREAEAAADVLATSVINLKETADFFDVVANLQHDRPQ